ncbi:SGNH/GDSL hydrolase family protein [Shimia sp. R11_0]|uniref:SGNH/GDSL hydrolase family protein n=1 Tax=Shimia sp. R11_0 TaxID=2821096 RepID=UPI001ADC8423|nr:SGNH/GDSL hydrolase family protein [Shimia sp. R11_0]MBO9476810.1 SGNH/GDSL hydrolase family protein [Shimia sp. R11_0]
MRKLKRVVLGVVLGIWALGAAAGDTKVAGFDSPEIVILGDSQIPFGSGPAFLEFFTDLKSHCAPNQEQETYLERLGAKRVAVIGVRSTSIHSWTARSGKAKEAVCKVDPKWKVNAGTYGYVNTTGNKYVQIGRGKAYQFCEPGQSPFEAMFRDGYYAPKLFLMSFLGNSARRWAESKEQAKADVEEMMRHIPEDVPCIFMTTAPAYSKKIVDLRLKAQENIQAAFEETGNRCSFVRGATEETVEAYQGNMEFFRLNKKGRVKDPYHPNQAAAENFFALEMGNICSAIFEQISTLPEPQTH